MLEASVLTTDPACLPADQAPVQAGPRCGWGAPAGAQWGWEDPELGRRFRAEAV